MDKNNGLRQELEKLPSEQLAQMLQDETAKDVPDDDLVLLLLHILEGRKTEDPAALGEGGEAAWQNYQAKRTRASGKKHFGWGMRAASLAVLVCLLFALIPQQATAGSVWKILTHWTEDIFEYINIGSSSKKLEPYVFHSEDPGLQEVYDAVTEELGIAEPVVPQWLPEGYELKEIEKNDSPSNNGIHAKFLFGKEEAVLSYREMSVDLSPKYEKSDTKLNLFEVNGVVHNYMWNKNNWTICWTRQNLKCTIYVNCQEEELQKIIQSIYEWE